MNLENTTGTPTATGENSRGRIVLFLPEGNYDFRVTAQVGNSTESHPQDFAPFTLKVGCGERLRVSPGMQMEVDAGLSCVGGLVRVGGSVRTPSGIPVSRIEWRTPGGVAQNICGVLNPCGLNPSFNFDLPINSPCAETVFTVTAFTADGDSVSVTRGYRDTVPPVLAVGADKTVECGSLWDFDPPVALADCGGAASVAVVGTVTNAVSPCSYTVDRTWRATDACGNFVERTQRVTVVDTTPPQIITSSLVEVPCPRRVNLDVFVNENCGSATTTFSPPNGSFFPPGNTIVRVRVVDACGLSAERQVTVRVLNNCPAATSLGIPTTLLGSAMAEGRSDGSLRLSGMGGTGQDGLRLDSGEVTGIRLDFDRSLAANQLPAGAESIVTALNAAGAPLAVLRLVRSSAFAVFEVIPSFDPPTAANYGVRFYNGSQLVHESLTRTAPPANQFPIQNQLFLSALPVAMRVAVRPGGGVVFEYYFGGPMNVSVFTSGNSANVSMDRMEVFASDPPTASEDYLSGLDLRFGGISERVITGMALTKFGQEFRSSQGAAMAGAQGSVAVVGYVNAPAPAPPAPPKPPVVWKTVNPLGYFGDSIPGNPSGYNGYWEVVNPLGHAGQWDLKIDLTGNSTSPLGFFVYRPGKSRAELTLAFPPIAEKATLRVVAGGVADPSPGALTVEMGALIFEGKTGRVELKAEFMRPSGPATQRLAVTLPDGTVKTFAGTPEELRVSWDQAANMPTGAIATAIGPEGALSMGIHLAQPGPLMIRLPDTTQVQATAMTWTADGGQTWTPGSLRGLLLVRNNDPPLIDDPPIIIAGLTTSVNNPTPASYFADHRISPLGHGTFRTDAFGALVLSGLTPSGEDGVAIEGFSMNEAAIPSSGSLRLNLGHLPFFSGNYPPAGSRLDLRVVSEVRPVPDQISFVTNAVLAGQSLNAGSPLILGVRFPNLQATKHTLRVFRGNLSVFNQAGRLNDPPTAQGNFVPYALPDGVEARIVSGKFTWVLTWNRVIGMEIYNQPGPNPFQGDRVEITADDAAQPYPGGLSTLELRAGSLDTLRLLNLGNRSAPPVPELNFGLSAGRFNLNWGEVVSGLPKLQVSPSVNGPWQNLGLGKLLAGGQRGFEIVPTGLQGYTRLATRTATEGCLDFSAATPGNHPNPLDFAGWKFDRFGPNDSHSPFNEIVEFDGNRELRFENRMDIELPAPAAGVDVLFRRSGGTVTFIAFDDAGEVFRKVAISMPSSGSLEAETISAPTARPLRRLRILGTSGPVNLRELCLRAFPFQDVAQSPSRLPLRTAALGSVANPWIQGDLTITARTANGATPPTGLISLYPNNVIVGYDVEHQAELHFARACPRVEIEFISGSGSVDFQPYDDLGTALPVYHLGRASSTYGETVVFTGNPRPIARVLVTSPGGQTRLMGIRGGPVPAPFCREVNDITVRPTQNPQPLGDTLWTFYDAAHVLASSTLRTNGVEVGLDLTAETVIDFATDQLSVELRIFVNAGGATISAEATTAGGSAVGSLASASYAAGAHTLSLTDSCGTCGVGARLRRVRLRLTAGNAIVTRVCTPFLEH